MGEHFNGLTPAEAERLSLLAEECAEVVQAVTKILRHGYQSYDPTACISERMTNQQALGKEMGHVLAAMQMLENAKDVHWIDVERGKDNKLATVDRWLHHQSDDGQRPLHGDHHGGDDG